MKKANKIAFCGLSSALSVVIMFLGGVLQIFTYAVPLILGIYMSAVAKTIGKRATFAIYVSTSILSLLLVTDKECVLMYVLFFGYYSIIMDKITVVKPKVLSVIIKLLMFNVSLFAVEFLSVYVFGIPFFEGEKFSLILVIAFAVLMNLIFIIFDVLMRKFLRLYSLKFEKAIKKYLK